MMNDSKQPEEMDVPQRRGAPDGELVESPYLLGNLYNLVVWEPKTAEHEYFRTQAPRVGEASPDFSLPSLDGGEVRLSSLRGKPVMVEFGSIT